MSVVSALNKRDVVALLTEMGVKDADALDDVKLKKKVSRIPALLEKDAIHEPESEEGLHTYEAVLNALETNEELEFVSEEEAGEDKPAKTPGRKRKLATKPEPQPKEKEIIERPTVTHKFEESEKSKEVLISEKLAKEWQEKPRFPKDRDFQQSRADRLEVEYLNGTFRGCEWADCYCEETKETYRMNGNHTSKVALKLFADGKEFPKFKILVRHYKAPTMADVAYLFSTYDPKWSGRSKNDLLKVYSSADENTKDLPPRMLTVVTSGIAFSKLEKGYRKLTTEEQATLLLDNSSFAKWASGLFDGIAAKNSKHLLRMSVFAAMLKTWGVDAEAAEEFWTKIRDDSDDPKDSPTRVLYRWLIGHKVGAREAKERVGEREVYFYCLKAWNAWRNEESSVKLTHYKEDARTPEVQ